MVFKLPFYESLVFQEAYFPEKQRNVPMKDTFSYLKVCPNNAPGVGDKEGMKW